MSNLFKPAHYRTLSTRKLIEVPEVPMPSAGSGGDADDGAEQQHHERDERLDQAAAISEQLIQDAQETAERLLDQAREDAEAIRARAREDIEAWWNERRAEDEAVFAEASRQGYEEGYRTGYAAAEQTVRNEYADMLEQARTILQTANEQKQAMIQEAEPFVLELSCEIAKKIIGRQLTLEPSWTLDLIKSVLARRREQGTITLCVSPSQYAYVLDARDDLYRAIDSQAELLIVADASVADHGCIVRSQYGSLDARIDTQLAEIRSALIQLATQKEEYSSDE